MGRGRRGLRIVAIGTREGLSPDQCDPRRLGHRGQRPGNGLRQYGRNLGNGRGVHAQSVDRRAGLLRRVPDQRTGRGCRRGHPYAAVSDARGARGGTGQASVDGGSAPRNVHRTRARVRPARNALPRHAGYRIHGAAGQVVDAADAERQAHRQGGAEDRGRHGRGRADHPRGSGRARRSGGARSIAPPDARSAGGARRHRHRSAGQPRRGVGCGGVRQRTRPKTVRPWANRSSSSAPKPARRIFRACTRPRAS